MQLNSHLATQRAVQQSPQQNHKVRQQRIQGGYNGRNVSWQPTSQQFKNQMVGQRSGSRTPQQHQQQRFQSRPQQQYRQQFRPQQRQQPNNHWQQPTPQRHNGPQLQHAGRNQHASALQQQRPNFQRTEQSVPKSEPTPPAKKESLNIVQKFFRWLFSLGKSDNSSANAAPKSKDTNTDFNLTNLKQNTNSKPAAQRSAAPQSTPTRTKANFRHPPQQQRVNQQRTNQQRPQTNLPQRHGNQPMRFQQRQGNGYGQVNTSRPPQQRTNHFRGNQKPTWKPTPAPIKSVWNKPSVLKAHDPFATGANQAPPSTGKVRRHPQSHYDAIINRNDFKDYTAEIRPQFDTVARLNRSGPSKSYAVHSGVPRFILNAPTHRVNSHHHNVSRDEKGKAAQSGALSITANNGVRLVRADVSKKLEILASMVTLVEAHNDGADKQLNRFATKGASVVSGLRDLNDLDTKLTQYEAMCREIIHERETAWTNHRN